MLCTVQCQLGASLTCNGSVCHVCQDHELAPMHGVKLFKDFVDKKETRRPEVMDLSSEHFMALVFDCLSYNLPTYYNE